MPSRMAAPADGFEEARIVEELEIYRSAYVVDAVAEIATRRGELFGRQVE